MKNKILLLAKSVDGGTGTFVNSILKLEKNGFEILPISLEKPSYRPVRDGKFRFYGGTKHYPQDYKASLSNIFSFLKELLWIRKITRKQNPNLFLGVDIHANLLLAINQSLFSRKTPILMTTHTGINETLLEKASPGASFLIKTFLSFFYKKAALHVCVSKKVAKSLKDTLKLTPEVIYNGVKKKNLSITPLKQNSPVFINIARLTKQKDHETLIKAFKKVRKKLPKSKLIIIGEGPKKKNLASLIKSQGVRGIDLVGWRKNPARLLKTANIFVLSSHREGLPFSLIEAMSFSKAIISTKTPHGPEEVLGKDKYGILVPVANEEKLAKEMVLMGKDGKRYIKFAKAAFERSKDFTEEKMLKEYRKVIDESIN